MTHGYVRSKGGTRMRKEYVGGGPELPRASSVAGGWRATAASSRAFGIARSKSCHKNWYKKWIQDITGWNDGMCETMVETRPGMLKTCEHMWPMWTTCQLHLGFPAKGLVGFALCIYIYTRYMSGSHRRCAPRQWDVLKLTTTALPSDPAEPDGSTGAWVRSTCYIIL